VSQLDLEVIALITAKQSLPLRLPGSNELHLYLCRASEQVRRCSWAASSLITAQT
jgi:hypothetical protein